MRFIELARAGDWNGAGAFLEQPREEGFDAARQARRLKAVLDRYVWLDLQQISPSALGNTEDGLPPGVDEIGSISTGVTGPEPVRLVRHEMADGARWLFSLETVARIDAWYATLKDRWILEHLPEWMTRSGPQDLLWWQWLALPVLVLLAFLLGTALSWISRRLFAPLFARTRNALDDELLARSNGPLTLLWAVAVARLLLPSLNLYRPGEAFILTLLKAGVLVALFWMALRTIDFGSKQIATSGLARQHPTSLGVLPVGARMLKVATVAMGAIAVLSEFGYPVASLLAGLGIGGLAVALAGQKTVENVFGSVSISVDQPFRIGDYVRIEDAVAGTVERIGLRSTRIRTSERTLVTIPNGKLADLRIETFAARDRIRLLQTLNLTRDTTSEQMRRIVADIAALLRAHPKSAKEGIGVHFVGIGASSLDVEVICWFATRSFDEFKALRQEVLLQILEVVEANGARLAFPSRTVHLAQREQMQSDHDGR